jgi:predicted lipase
MNLNQEMALFCLDLAQAAYTQIYSNTGCTNIQEFTDLDTDTQGFSGIASDQTLVIAFAGSESAKDWVNNVKFLHTPYPSVTQNQNLKVHYGFYTGYLSVRSVIHDRVESEQPEKVIVTGHSLGGGLSTLCALDVQYNFFANQPEQVVCYTYGSPKVGNQDFVASYNRRVPQTFRIVNGGDGAPWFPRPWQGYAHVDTLFRIDGSVLRVVFAATGDHLIPAYCKSLNDL